MQDKNPKFRRLILCSVVALCAVSNLGCKDRYQEGFDAGYAEGFSRAKLDVENRCEERLEEERRSCRDRSYSAGAPRVYSTEVCGGDGVTTNGKHYSGGKTGCVRVHSDGRVEQY